MNPCLAGVHYVSTESGIVRERVLQAAIFACLLLACRLKCFHLATSMFTPETYVGHHGEKF